MLIVYYVIDCPASFFYALKYLKLIYFNMNRFKNYLLCFLFGICLVLLYLVFCSIFLFFDIFNYEVIHIINYVFLLIVFFICGFRCSMYEKRKGYLNGFIIGVMFVMFFSLISLIFSHLELSSLVYYISLIMSCIVGGIFGVNKKAS